MHTSTIISTVLAAASFLVSSVGATGDYAPFQDGSCVPGKFYCGRDIIRESGTIPLGPENGHYNPSYVYVCDSSRLGLKKPLRENRLRYYETCEDGLAKDVKYFECDVFERGNKVGCLYDGHRKLLHGGKAEEEW